MSPHAMQEKWHEKLQLILHNYQKCEGFIECFWEVELRIFKERKELVYVQCGKCIIYISICYKIW